MTLPVRSTRRTVTAVPKANPEVHDLMQAPETDAHISNCSTQLQTTQTKLGVR